MKFDWNNYYELGQRLTQIDAKDHLSEASFRTSTSRVYYAAYWTARSFAEKNGLCLESQDQGCHLGVLNWYRERNFDRLYKNAFDQLKRLREKRTQADYVVNRLGATGWRTIADDAIADADKFFEIMRFVSNKALPKPPKRNK